MKPHMIKQLFKWKDLKLGIKLSISFGILIAIFSILVIVGLINRQDVYKKACNMGKDYIPMVGITFNMEHFTNETMRVTRGLSLSEEDKNHQTAKSNIARLEQYHNQADSMIHTSPALARFKDTNKQIGEEISEFMHYTEEMAILKDSIRQLSQNIDSTYTVFNSLSNELLIKVYVDFRDKINNPNASVNELVKHYRLTKMIDAIIAKGNVSRIGTLQAVSQKSPKLIEDVNLQTFRYIFTLIKMMRSIADSQSKGILDQIEGSMVYYQENMLTLANCIDGYNYWEIKTEESALSMLSKAHNISSESNKITAQTSVETISLLESSTRFLIIGLILSQLMAILFSVITTQKITRTIRKIADFAQKVALGIISTKVEVDQNNEVGILADALNSMQFKLKDNTQAIKLVEKRMVNSIIETEQKERKRFAEDLHDGLGPLLSTIKLYINSFASKRNNLEQRQLMLEKANELINEAIANTKCIANNMMPMLLNDFGLEVALNSFFKHVMNTNSLNIQFHCVSNGIRPDPKIEFILYNTILELTNNTIKHAKATSVHVHIRQNDDIFEVVYQDDGIGCDLEYIYNNNPQHLGLKNIINRIMSINGFINFWSGENIGLKARIQI
jgi:signal transduction histidine kinase